MITKEKLEKRIVDLTEEKNAYEGVDESVISYIEGMIAMLNEILTIYFEVKP
jgi:low affinity Fe/Cu permease